MSEADEEYETSSISSTTTKSSSRFGTWGGRGSLLESRRMGMDESDPWPTSLLDWGDNEKSSVSAERIVTSTSTSRRMSDLSSTASDRDVETGGSAANLHDNMVKQSTYDTFPRRSSGGLRSRLTANFSRDDFNERMESMIKEFDERCSRSFWDDRGDRRRLFGRRDKDDDDFFSRSRISNSRFFQRASTLRSMFDDPFEDAWSSERKLTHDDGYADSGIFSDGASSRGRRHTDESFKTDKTSVQERRCPPEKFEVDIDVQGFKASDLLVRTEGRRLVICAKTNKEQETGPKASAREFKREFDLPDGVNPYDVTSNLMPDGYLRVEAPVKNYAAYASAIHQNERETISPTSGRQVPSPPGTSGASSH